MFRCFFLSLGHTKLITCFTDPAGQVFAFPKKKKKGGALNGGRGF